MSIAVGWSCAFFLWSLDEVTTMRFDHPWLLFLLPLAGLAIGYTYQKIGKPAEGGNNLIVEQIHEPGGGIPRRMAPLILLSTLVTHLFGGSAGREGTAIQMGGSIASAFSRMLRLDQSSLRIMLMSGVAAGFGAVFGTPLAGAIFAVEVLSIGRIRYQALLPCLTAAVIADWACTSWDIKHTRYHIGFNGDLGGVDGGVFHLDVRLLLYVVAAGIIFGWLSRLFSECTHKSSAVFKQLIASAPWRPFVGGMIVIGLVYIAGTRDYLGLGVWSNDPGAVTIQSFFQSPDIHFSAWAWKLIFTVVTLSSGFKGGEVTPLFFIGAAAGNAFAGATGLPPDLFAALGFIAIFAGATNTPLACTIMGIELFGAEHAVYMAIACFAAYHASGHSGIYLSQRIAHPKISTPHHAGEPTLREIRQGKKSSCPLKSEHQK